MTGVQTCALPIWTQFNSVAQSCLILYNPMDCSTPSLPVHQQLLVKVKSLSHIQFFVTPWTVACQASLSITNSRSLLKLMFIKSVMPSNHLILCHPLLLLPSVFPSIRVFSSESGFYIMWPKDWSFSFSVSPSNEYSVLISKGLSRVFSNTTVQKHQFNAAQFSI